MEHRKVSVRSFFLSLSLEVFISEYRMFSIFCVCLNWICACVCVESLVWIVFSCTCWCLLLKFQIVLWCCRTFSLSLFLVALFFIPFLLIFYWHSPQSLILLSIIPFLLLLFSSFTLTKHVCIANIRTYECVSFSTMCIWGLDKHIKMRKQTYTHITHAHMHSHIWTGMYMKAVTQTHESQIEKV